MGKYACTAQNWERNYYFTQFDKHILFIQYNICQEDEAQFIEDFHQALLHEFENEEYAAVVVDLRYNHGGMYALFSNVIDMIGQNSQESGIDLFA